MTLYIEAIIWYLLVIDCLAYNILAWSKGKLHDQVSHWITNYFPLSKSVGIMYLVFMIWLGYALYRLQIVLGFLR